MVRACWPDGSGPAARPLARTRVSRTAEATKLAASVSATAARPPAATRMPPIAEPASRDAFET